MIRTLATPTDFNFRSAVCSHGFFALSPNRWNPATGTLTTVITIDDRRAIAVDISNRDRRLAIRSRSKLARDEVILVRSVVSRILRLEENFGSFHAECKKRTSHRNAAKSRFGRLIRSGSLFEDIVKVICTCNVAWRQTVAMIDKIVSHWGVPIDEGDAKGFPTPARLANATAADLRRIARVGYRAEFIHRLACEAADGRLDLQAIERFDGPSEQLHKTFRRIHGVGDYAAGNLCMLLGRYDRLAIDTEMMRLLHHRHPRKRWTPAAIRAYYAAWQPHQFLAYWYELWADYEERHGRSDQWSSESTGPQITQSPRKPSK